MNILKLIEFFESYYNLQYSDTEKTELTKYLYENFNEFDLEEVQAITIKNHSKKWKVLPDIAVIQQAVDDKNETWKDLCDNMLIGVGNKKFLKILENERKNYD